MGLVYFMTGEIKDDERLIRPEESMEDKPIAAGKSSFDLVEVELVFNELSLQEGTVFLDAACGAGEYALAASRYIGERGVVYAVDLWEEGIEALRKAIKERRIGNIKAFSGDLGQRLPIPAGEVDICLMATVVHDFIEIDIHNIVLGEVKRLLKPGGRLAVIEFKKIAGPPGPPVGIRVTPDELDAVVHPHGFARERTLEVGDYNYLSLYRLG